MPQTAYVRTFNEAFAGQLGDSGPQRQSSRANTTGAAISAGILVCEGTTDGSLALPALSTDKLVGGVVNSFNRDPGNGTSSLSGTQAYLANAQVPLLEEGSLFVVSETSMAETDSIFVRYSANGGNTVLGAISNTSDGGHNRQVKGARVLRGTSVAGPVMIYLSVAVDRSQV